MIFRITMKDPDGVHDCIQDAARESIAGLPTLDDREKDELTEIRREKLGNLCEKWFEFGEYLTVELDTEAKTCRVVEVGK